MSTFKYISCPNCNKGPLQLATYNDVFDNEYGEPVIVVKDLLCCVCQSCKSTPILTDQIRHNEQLVAKAKIEAHDY